MFGNNKPFGTASAFGASTFGGTSTPFGQTTNTAFGAKPSTSNVFGTSAFGVTQPNTGGLFGSSTPASGTGLFGQPSTAFGAPASTSTGGFGFGATSTSGGLFGNPAPTTQSTGGLFGGGTSAFGAPRPAFGGFGTTTPSTGLFGQSTSTGTGLFGSSGGFTSSTQMGTTIKFNPPTGTDTMMKGGVSTSIGTRHQCITCMKEYENKSLEELRVEDYAAGRKGSANAGMGFGGTTQQTGLFGTPASTSGFGFGNTTQSKSLFGTTGTTNTFGAGGNVFGQTTQTQNTGLFGKSVGFGAPTTSAAPVFNFGTNTGTSLFGQNNQQKPLFGQTSNVGTGLFGNTATTQSTGFGTTTGFGTFGAANQPSTGLFGAKPTGFGTTNTTTTSTFSFGNTSMSGGGLFGQKPAAPAFGATPGFGTQTTGFGSFGTNQNTGTGLFGQTKPTTSVFGGTGTTFGTGLGNTFGGTSFSSGLGTNTGTGLFGANANKGPGFSFGGTGSTGFNFGGSNTSGSGFNFNAPSSSMPGSDVNNPAALQQIQNQILAMAVNPFGDSPLFRNPIKDTPREVEVLKPTNPSAQKALLNDNHYKVALLPTAKIKPKPWSPNPNGKVFLFDGLEDEEPSLGNASFLPKKSVKKLVLKNVAHNQSTLTLTSFSGSASQPTRIDVSISLKKTDSSPNSGNNSSPPTVPLTFDISNSSPSKIYEVNTPSQISGSKSNESFSQEYLAMQDNSLIHMNDSISQLHTNKQTPPNKSYSIWSESEEERQNSSLAEPSSFSINADTEVATNKNHQAGIILNRPGYFTIPPLDTIVTYADGDGNCYIENFTVGREGYGKVLFPGRINVTGLNLDEIVHFNKKEIVVYPDDNKKPPIGEGLNRKAVVTLENVWPTDKTTHSPIKDPDRLSKVGYREKIIKSTSRLGATFIDYKPETGSWIFQVDHFSKYGLVDDSDEEMDIPDQAETKAKSVVPLNETGIMNGARDLNETMPKMPLKRKSVASFPAEDEEMEGISARMPSQDMSGEDFLNEVYSPTRPILKSVMDIERIQSMKASFFQEYNDEDNWDYVSTEKQSIFMPDKSKDHADDQVPYRLKCDLISNEVSKRMKHTDYDTSKSFLPDVSDLKRSEIGIQHSLSSLSISTTKKDGWMSVFPVIKSSPPPLPLFQSDTVSVILNKINLKPLKKSVLYGKEHLIADAGYFMGRSFRVGWRSDGTYTHLESLEEQNKLTELSPFFLLYGQQVASSDKFPKSLPNSSFAVRLEKLDVLNGFQDNIKNVQKNLIDALKLQLENSVSTVEEEVPLFVPKPGVDVIHAHSDLFENQLKDTDPVDPDAYFTQQCVHVWNLLVSLWGRVRGLDVDRTPSHYECQIARREALSRWLIKTTESDINKEVSSMHQADNYLRKIFMYLSGRKISDAVKVAQYFQDFQLSLLVSQAEGTDIVRKLISGQLLNWEQNGAYKFIKSDRIILYALLAGMLFWENVYEKVNCCKNLNWKQTLSLHLWYHCSSNSSIQDAVEEYDKSFQGSATQEKYSLAPYPPYVDISGVEKEDADQDEHSDDAVHDTCYHLLKLFCDRTHRLDRLLMPETYSLNHLDYRLSWLLHLALSSIGYNIPAELSCTLHMNFAMQLESINMWHWAIFVFLHHPDVELRMKNVKDIILRHVSLEQTEDSQEKENFIKKHLLIPDKWIYEAKAIRARCENKHAEEAWFLLKAGFWSKSHDIIIKYLASDAVINEDYDYLMKYLVELAVPERSCTILDWANGGQVYLDYINICQVVQGILSRETSAYDLEKFMPEVISLCSRLSTIPTTTLKDRLSVAEMAKKTATILRSIAILQANSDKNHASLSKLASYFKNLPMPQDYAVSENRFIAHYMLEKVTAEM